MNFFDIDILDRDPNQDNLYDLTQITFKKLGIGSFYNYEVEVFQEMRIDLISQELYASTDYCDFLLNLNGIDNPLNIKAGDVLIYVDIEDIDQFRVSVDNPKVVQRALLNPNKQTRKDQKRQDYTEENFSLSPTLLETPVESVQVRNNSILIGINENTNI